MAWHSPKFIFLKMSPSNVIWGGESENRRSKKGIFGIDVDLCGDLIPQTVNADKLNRYRSFRIRWKPVGK